MTESELYARFGALFNDCNRLSKGVFHPKSGNMSTLSESVRDSDFSSHLSGVQGLGLVPIMEDSTARWGAIDIDAHDDGHEVDLVQLEAQVRKLDLPLMVCRSKSGGSHLYVFLSSPVPAKDLRSTLRGWLVQLGLPPSTEIFPKQDSLQPGQKGNWINLCYFDHSSTVRYCVEGGKPVSLEYFVELAESRRVDPRTLTSKALGRHAEAPPCICRMLADGVESGARNTCLFHFAVYAKQAFPDSWETEVEEFSRKAFKKPMRSSEVNSVKKSASGSKSKYKCNDEYIKTLCDSDLCVKRDFGIPRSDVDGLDRWEAPEFNFVERVGSDPYRWTLHIGDKQITLSTSVFRRYQQVADEVLGYLGIDLPPMKEERWSIIRKKLVEEARVVEASPEMSESYMVLERVRFFVQSVGLNNPDALDTRPEARWNMTAGMPCVQKGKNDELIVMFRGADVLEAAKRASEKFDATKLHIIMTGLGAKNKAVRLPKTESNPSDKTFVRVWMLPLEKLNITNLEPVDIKTEF